MSRKDQAKTDGLRGFIPKTSDLDIAERSIEHAFGIWRVDYEIDSYSVHVGFPVTGGQWHLRPSALMVRLFSPGLVQFHFLPLQYT
jgi:hypothetical protein